MSSEEKVICTMCETDYHGEASLDHTLGHIWLCVRCSEWLEKERDKSVAAMLRAAHVLARGAGYKDGRATQHNRDKQKLIKRAEKEADDLLGEDWSN